MTRVALLWHMHQPYYVDRATGAHILPWVRLHGLKDYWGMAAVAREFPTLRITFNLVPSLLEQVDAFAHDEARDRHLDLGLRDAREITPADARWCVDEFFHAHYGRMIGPYPRYAELQRRRHEWRAGGEAFTVDELRDLQVWHKLAWVDPGYATDTRIVALHAKGREFSEADKVTLREVELEILRRVIPEYRAALEDGHELSTSPYYHPILPLLCDLAVYRETHPEWPLPDEPFRHPQDAAEQLARSIALHTRLFGTRPDGLWPSEGSVSNEMVGIVSQAGFSWMATDEEILGRSRNITFHRDSNGVVQHAADLYRAHAVDVGGATVACGFRDHVLSDLIGFSYASWRAEDAAADFVRRIAAAGASARASGLDDPTVFVILDGENAWEHFEGQGRPFLRALYAALTSHPEVTTVTMREACRRPTGRITSIHPGSWIHSDFYIWAGHADDRRAWAQVARARRHVDAQPADRPGLADARESILVAEGSDWFWWYGDDHSSDHDQAFDELFRRHLRNAYTALGDAPPADLFVSNITTDMAVLPTAPCAPLTPHIDGRQSSYFEWLGAGWFETRASFGSMHSVTSDEGRLRGLGYGYGPSDLFISLVPEANGPAIPTGGIVILTIQGTSPVLVTVNHMGAHTVQGTNRSGQCEVAVGAYVELRIPLTMIGVDQAGRVPISLTLRTSDGQESSWGTTLAGPDAGVSSHWRA